ncbi:MAG: DNA topoisomerase VI subunit B [Thermoplasmata archaeon]|nr:DNA topoisomerase VI subunit B [Thermoplasmata archaeon]
MANDNGTASELTGGIVAEPIANKLAADLKEISVAEFFERNKQILGFDSLHRSILTAVKEAVDNALDACEEAEILPDIDIKIEKGTTKDELVMTVEDNGPGIVKKQIENIFARLLYGSRFHAIRQARGQQGIGISAVVMYGQLTTGRPARVLSKIGPEMPAYEMDIYLDTKANRPEVVRSEAVHWDKDHGTRVTISLSAKYAKERRQSVFEYLKATAIVNPHAHITFLEPTGETYVFPRVTDKTPAKTESIKPHPLGIELGTLMKMAKATEAYRMTSFLIKEFSRISQRTAREVCRKADVDELLRPQDMNRVQAMRVLEAFNMVKIMAPPTDCLSPIGDSLMRKGLRKEIDTKFAHTVTRAPSVFAGHPFQVEVGIVYGGDISADAPVKILRYANRVPLLYQQGGCVITHAVEGIDWRPYGLEQRGGTGIPVGPAMLLVHVASTNVPFTSESKEAIADVPEIIDEVQLALRECARKLKAHINKKERLKKIAEKYEIIQKVLPRLAEKSASVIGKKVPPIDVVVTKIMNVVVIEDNTEHDVVDGKGITTVGIDVVNYTPKQRNITIACKVPVAELGKVDPKPSRREEGLVVWKVTKMEPTEKRHITLELVGLEKDAYEEAEVFFEGLKADQVIGAEPL